MAERARIEKEKQDEVDRLEEEKQEALAAKAEEIRLVREEETRQTQVCQCIRV